MSLRDFLKQMDEEKNVLHVKDEVSTRFEASQVMKSFDYEGPIILFEKLKDFDVKVVANVCGTRKRVARALNVSSDGLCERLAGAWRMPRRPKIVKDGLRKRSAERTVDLPKIPILTHFE